MPSAVALVPARAGSVRVADKNVLRLGGHPLLAHSIWTARESRVFSAVLVSTDSPPIAAVGRHYGAEVLSLRPAEMATATSPDIEWVRHVLGELAAEGRTFDAFSILRPTSPFRVAATVRRAWTRFLAARGADSLRAVERCRQHPGKMWVLDGELIRPLLPQPEGTPYHSRQYQALPEVYVQNSSLEIAWTRVALEGGTIAGDRVAPFFTEGTEGFSIDYPEDVERAEQLLAAGEARLPNIAQEPFSMELAR
jgi:CMP-N,N'-diacetyllegionaminic acid synthase